MSPGKPTTLKVRGTNRHWFVLRIMAYITVENEIEEWSSKSDCRTSRINIIQELVRNASFGVTS